MEPGNKYIYKLKEDFQFLQYSLKRDKIPIVFCDGDLEYEIRKDDISYRYQLWAKCSPVYILVKEFETKEKLLTYLLISSKQKKGSVNETHHV